MRDRIKTRAFLYAFLRATSYTIPFTQVKIYKYYRVIQSLGVALCRHLIYAVYLRIPLTNSMIVFARTIFEIGRYPGGWGVDSEIAEGVGGVNKT